MVGLPALHPRPHVLDLRQAQLEIAALSVRTDAVYAGFALGVGGVVLLVGQEGRSYHLMDVVLVFADVLPGSEELLLEELFVLLFIFGRQRRLRGRLHLPMNNLINGHISILVLLLLLFLLGVELLPFSHLRKFLEDIRIILGVVF